MKIRLFLLLFICFAASARAQHSSKIPLMTKVWELIADKTYKQDSKKQWVVSFPPALKALDNKVIELPGYIIPVKAGLKHSTFMFSVVPTEQCPFCGQGDIPSMIEVRAAKPLEFSEKPVRIKGKLVLNESGDGNSEIFLLNASPAS